jgi:hypothetical protein
LLDRLQYLQQVWQQVEQPVPQAVVEVHPVAVEAEHPQNLKA